MAAANKRLEIAVSYIGHVVNLKNHCLACMLWERLQHAIPLKAAHWSRVDEEYSLIISKAHFSIQDALQLLVSFITSVQAMQRALPMSRPVSFVDL